jgi:hypothetical protein
MGSAGRWPAVFGVPPNTSGDTDWKNQTVFLATQPDGRRRVGDDSTRAACSPRSTASLRLIVLLAVVRGFAAGKNHRHEIVGKFCFGDRLRLVL